METLELCLALPDADSFFCSAFLSLLFFPLYFYENEANVHQVLTMGKSLN